MNARFSRTREGHSSTERMRVLADVFDMEIFKNTKPGSPWEFFLRVRLLPIGQPALEIIVQTEAWKQQGEWLRLKFPHGDRIVWNIFQGFQAPENLKEELTDGTFLRQLQQGSAYKFPSKSSPVCALGKLLEANLSYSFSASEISCLNATRTAASPAEVDLGMRRRTISKEGRSRSNLAPDFPNFFKALSRIRQALESPESMEATHRVFDEAPPNASKEEQTAFSWLKEICSKAIMRKKLLKHGAVKAHSLLRALSTLPSMSRQLLSSQGEPFYFTDNHLKAASFLNDVCSEETRKRLQAEFQNGQRASPTLRVNLVGYQAMRRHFGLDAGYPTPSDVGQCARRLILLVMSCGRRLSCMHGVTPGDFLDGEYPFLILGKTKVPHCAHFRLPLGILLPPQDVRFARQWIARLPTAAREKSFLELAGINPAWLSQSIDHAKIHGAYVDLLRRDFGWSKRPRLHDLRRMSITWLSVRLALADYPDIPLPACLQGELDAPIFEQSALRACKEFFGAEDPIEILAKVAGHSCRITSRKVYDFSFPVSSALTARKRWEHLKRMIALDQMAIFPERETTGSR